MAKKQKRKLIRKINITEKLIGMTITVAAVAVVYFFLNEGRTKRASADSSDNMSGFAWTSTIGWISFNSSNCDSNGDGITDNINFSACPAGEIIAPYGASLNLGTGDIENNSYGWSSNVGWLDFNPIGSSGLIPPAVSTGDDYIFDVKKVGSEFRGWAKFAAMPDSPDKKGWVRFSPDPNDIWYNEGKGGVKYAGICADGKVKLAGYAWSDDFGWISFDGTTLDSNTYGARVDTVPEKPVLDPIPGAYPLCDQVVVGWNSVENALGYFVERNDGTGWNPACGLPIGRALNPEVEDCVDSGLSPGAFCSYRVSAQGECGNSSWSDLDSTETKSICEFNSEGSCGTSEVCAEGKCPNKVKLSWDEPLAKLGAELEYTVWRKEVKDEDGNPVSGIFEEASGGCKKIKTTSCTDVVGSEEDGRKTFIYKVIAENKNDGSLSESQPSLEVKPCVPLPSWKEIIPR